MTPNVHAAYTRLSKASGTSIGREMGDWLGSTLEAVELTASMIERARTAPHTVMQEISAQAEILAEGMQGGLASLIAKMGGGNGDSGTAALAAGPESLSPPSSNTGGKVPRVNPNSPSKGAAKPKRRSSSLARAEKKGS